MNLTVVIASYNDGINLIETDMGQFGPFHDFLFTKRFVLVFRQIEDMNLFGQIIIEEIEIGSSA